MKLSLSLSEASAPDWLDTEITEKLQRIAATIVDPSSPVDVIVVGDEYIQKINREYRGYDRPTDVISFSYMDDDESTPEKDDLAGEVYVSYQTLEREAKSQGIDIGHLFLRIGAHGLLHILGFDHKTDADAVRMETEERRLLSSEMTKSDIDKLF